MHLITGLTLPFTGSVERLECVMMLDFRSMGGRGIYEKKRSVKRISFWWEQRESNPRPSACKADALNQLSYAPFGGADGTRTRDPRRDRPVF